MFVWNPQVLYVHEPKFQIQNSVYTDQFAPHGATKSGSTLFCFANLGKCASSFSTYFRAYFKTLGPTEGKERNFHLVFPFFEQLLSIFQIEMTQTSLLHFGSVSHGSILFEKILCWVNDRSQ